MRGGQPPASDPLHNASRAEGLDDVGRVTLFALLAAGLTLFFVQSLRHQRKLRPGRGLQGAARVLQVNARRQQLEGGSSSFDSSNGFGSDGVDADDALGAIMALGAVAAALDRRIRAAPTATSVLGLTRADGFEHGRVHQG